MPASSTSCGHRLDGVHSPWLVHWTWQHRTQSRWIPEWETCGNIFLLSPYCPWLRRDTCVFWKTTIMHIVILVRIHLCWRFMADWRLRSFALLRPTNVYGHFQFYGRSMSYVIYTVTCNSCLWSLTVLKPIDVLGNCHSMVSNRNMDVASIIVFGRNTIFFSYLCNKE